MVPSFCIPAWGFAKEIVMSSEWADSLISERNRKVEQRRIEDERVENDSKLVATNIEPRWKSICKLVKQYVQELNEASKEHLLRPIVEPTSIAIALRGRRRSFTRIDLNLSRKQLNVPFYKLPLRLIVNRSGVLIWKSSATSDPRSLWNEDQIAKLFVEYAWDHLHR